MKTIHTPRPLQAAIVGAGQIARQYAACLQQLDGVELVAICDQKHPVSYIEAWRRTGQFAAADAREPADG